VEKGEETQRKNSRCPIRVGLVVRRSDVCGRARREICNAIGKTLKLKTLDKTSQGRRSRRSSITA